MTYTTIATSVGVFSNNTSIDSTELSNWINEGYQKFVTAKDWPWAVTIYGTPSVAYKANYALPSDWRKWRWLKVDGVRYDQVETEEFTSNSNTYVVLEDDSNILINPIPTSASSSTLSSNAETAGSAVTIEVPDTTDLAIGDLVYIEGASGGATVKEITSISAVSDNVSITVPRLKHSYDASAVVMNINQGITGEYWVTPTSISGSTSPIIPSRWHLSLAKYGTSLYYRSIEEPTLADYWLREFNNDVALAWKETHLRSADGRFEFSLEH